MRRLSARETAAAISQLRIDRPLAPAFGFVDPAGAVRYAFHTHRRHQLIVPLAGAVAVESGGNLCVAGPGQAIWIPAGVRHATTMQAARKATVFFTPRDFPTSDRALRVFAVPAVVGAMTAHAATLPEGGATSRTFFAALHALCVQAMRRPALPTLPGAASAGLQRAIETLLADLAAPDPTTIAQHSGMSARTLRRAFRAETGLSLREYTHRARMLLATRLLADDNATVLDVALACGFASPSAFAAAFTRFSGASPREFRRPG